MTPDEQRAQELLDQIGDFLVVRNIEMLRGGKDVLALLLPYVRDSARYQCLRRALSDRSKNGRSHHLCSISEGKPQELDEAIDELRAAIDRARSEGEG